MHRYGQSEIGDPRQHGQRHQAGLRAVVDEAGFAARAEPAHIPSHQAVNQADECRREDQRQREHQDQQAHQEGERREGRSDQVAFGPDIDLADVVAEVAALPVAGRADALGGLAHALQQPRAHEHPLVPGIHQLVRRAPGLLHHHAAREVVGQVPEFVLQHLLGVAPALVLPEQVHADALHHDREQQRANEHPEQPER
ncbi:hypothetical protein G6F24_000423 [Rhizopus arrhizus]|nr:hypothetical protein G6F24_000423 [Rhizopus arrhizus]